MSTTHDRRGRHRQAARKVTIAVATVALTGTGVAMAADGGAAPPTTKAAAGGAESAKKAELAKQGPRMGEPGPLAEDEPIVIQVRARLGRLVAEGAIGQAEAEAVERDVIAGSVEPDALVRAGEVSSAHMRTINHVLREVKRANEPAAG
jgi:hypothetical protein